jgi:glyceraldehyde 3-phosphate dehydrogenase
MEDASAEKGFDVVLINVGPALPEHIAYTFKYDTIMGTFDGTVVYENGHLIINNYEIPVIAECDPHALPWKEHKVDWVVDCSGNYTRREQAQCHLDCGAKHVLISAPAHDEDVCIIPGVNDTDFNEDTHRIVSLGSCTTNAFLPLLHYIDAAFGLVSGAMTTIHAYTNAQVLLDVECGSKDIRRSRAAALNIIPTTTGAATTIRKIRPDLGQKIQACALRVPIGDVSLIDFAFTTHKSMTAELINKVFCTASLQRPTVIQVSLEPLVSSDYIGNSHSVVVDGLSTQVHEGMGRVLGWYDNEWGYACRLRDFLKQRAPM